MAAKAAKVTRASWSRYESAERLAHPTLKKIAKVLDVSIEDLIAGSTAIEVPAAIPVDPAAIPVIGLAACDVGGWFSPSPLAITAPQPMEYPGADRLFAVIAIGKSMEPDGIREGYLLFCDPGVEPLPGDAIYLKTKDGKATIKRFVKRGTTAVTMQGWLDPDKDGNQKVFTLQVPPMWVETLACVVIVKRKA